MKDFLKNNGLWILFATAVIAASLAVMSYLSNTSAPLVNLTNAIASPFRSVYTAVATWFNDKQNYYKDTSAMEEEIAALRKQVAQMERENRQALADSAENARLRKLLNLRPQKYELQLEASLITEHEVTNWTSSLTLNKGTEHGVKVNDCVVDETYALVGLVNQVGNNWCTVLTTVDTETSLGAQVFRTKDLGLAEGDFALMEDNCLRLNYLPANCQLLAGDLVETSGLGGYFPSGLSIGTVKEVQVDESGSASYAILDPGVDFDALTEVFVIKSFDIVT